MKPGKLHAIVLAAAIAGTGAPAEACRSQAQMTTTLLPELPATANQEDVIAKIEVIELVAWRAKVRVVAAIKGTARDHVIVIDNDGSTCDLIFSGHSLGVGVQAYIAGRMTTNAQDESIFEGRWQAFPEKRERLRMRGH
jgi:hypothetical protein